MDQVESNNKNSKVKIDMVTTIIIILALLIEPLIIYLAISEVAANGFSEVVFVPFVWLGMVGIIFWTSMRGAKEKNTASMKKLTDTKHSINVDPSSQARYVVEFKVLPNMLQERSKQVIEGILAGGGQVFANLYNAALEMLQERITKKFEEQDFIVYTPIDFEKFRIIRVDLPDQGEHCTTFPPTSMRLYIKFEDEYANVVLFTIERGFDIIMLCSINADGLHTNYGKVTTTDDELSKICSILGVEVLSNKGVEQ